jgi:2'-5' RNA ligase
MGLLDEASNQVFNELDLFMENEGIKVIDLPPHITLGTYENIEEKELLDYIKSFASNYEPIPLRFSHLGIFEDNVLFAEPKVTKQLLDFHEDLHQKYDDLYSRNGYFYSLKSNSWVPHVSLSIGNRARILDSLDVMLDYFKAFDGYLKYIAIYEFYPITKLHTIELKRHE